MREGMNPQTKTPPGGKVVRIAQGTFLLVAVGAVLIHFFAHPAGYFIAAAGFVGMLVTGLTYTSIQGREHRRKVEERKRRAAELRNEC